jgi:hypothetical protein
VEAQVAGPIEAPGTCIPSPIKLRNASPKMASGTVKVRFTMIGPIEFGIRCFHTSRGPLAPRDLEARANSCSLSCIILPRTILAMNVHPVIPRAMVMVMIPGFSTNHREDGYDEGGEAVEDLDAALHDVVHPAPRNPETAPKVTPKKRSRKAARKPM